MSETYPHALNCAKQYFMKGLDGIRRQTAECNCHVQEITRLQSEIERLKQEHSAYIQKTACIARDFGAMESRAIFAESQSTAREKRLGEIVGNMHIAYHVWCEADACAFCEQLATLEESPIREHENDRH